MFFERFKNIDLNKIALEYLDDSISYGLLLNEVKQRAGYFKNHRFDYLLCHPSEKENLLNFLALLYTGLKGVFAGKDTSEELKMGYSEKYNLKVLDFIPQSQDVLEEAHKPVDSEYFLGILSSGSTGTPKIIWKDYQSWFSAFPIQSEVFGMGSEDKVMVLDALGYSANLNTVLHTLWLGGTVLLTHLNQAKNWSNLIIQHHISSIFLVPSHYRLLPDNVVFSNINSIVSAGEKLDIKLAEKLLRIFPNANLTEYYGAAELGHITYIQNQEIITNPTSVGKPFPGVSIAIKENKIWVSSPYISPEYRNNPTVLDLGYIDSSNNLCLLGRQGRMFNRRGLNIYAQEIESVAVLHPFISEAALLKNKESLHLFLVSNKEVSSSEIRSFLLRSIPKQKLPNKILFTQALPRNLSGKVDFKVLAKRPIEEEYRIV